MKANPNASIGNVALVIMIVITAGVGLAVASAIPNKEDAIVYLKLLPFVILAVAVSIIAARKKDSRNG